MLGRCLEPDGPCVIRVGQHDGVSRLGDARNGEEPTDVSHDTLWATSGVRF